VQKKGLAGREEELHGEICIWIKVVGPLCGARCYWCVMLRTRNTEAYFDLWFQCSISHDAFSLCMFIICSVDGVDLLGSRAQHLELNTVLKVGICKSPLVLVDEFLV